MRLKDFAFELFDRAPAEFQFHIGAIKSVWEAASKMSFQDFNSTLVRLKANVTAIQVLHFEFQFHIGAIKRNNWALYTNSFNIFQFHIGAIKSERSEAICFNT